MTPQNIQSVVDFWNHHQTVLIIIIALFSAASGIYMLPSWMKRDIQGYDEPGDIRSLTSRLLRLSNVAFLAAFGVEIYSALKKPPFGSPSTHRAFVMIVLCAYAIRRWENGTFSQED